jgi:hypothetical protein
VNQIIKYCFLFGLLGSSMLDASELKSDENIQFFPSVASLQSDGKIQGNVESWVYENEARPGINSLLARYLKLDIKTMTPGERELYTQRTQLFRVDSERGKQLHISFDSQADIVLNKTSAMGRSSTMVTLANAVVTPLKTQWLNYHARLRKGDTRVMQGRLLFIPAKGISVVSDIDDTIKISNVLDRKQLLINTFARPFQAVPGTAEHYREIAEQPDSAFHYVSGSPHHLYPALADFLHDAGFPEGSMHLRDINLRQEIFSHQNGTEQHKLTVVRKLLRDFPQRQFIFFGDSGELDPEIYGQLAREFSSQVIEIHIRDVTKQSRTDLRYAKAFRDIPAQHWSISAAGTSN